MLSIKGEFSENLPSDGHILLKGVKLISARISHISWTILLKFGIDYLRFITPSDYEFHVIRHSDSYILLSNLSEILSLLPHLLSDWREIRYKTAWTWRCWVFINVVRIAAGKAVVL
jgi:hypothetical protein